jgi:hypothetical protein
LISRLALLGYNLSKFRSVEFPVTIFSNPNFVGWSTIGSVASWLLQFVFLGLMFSVAMSPYGMMSDFSYMFGALLTLPFMVAFYLLYRAEQGMLSLLALLIGVTGVIIINVSQFRLVIKQLILEQNMPQVALGTGLIGLSILLFNLLGRGEAQFPSGFTWLGIVLGTMMGMGILVASFYGKEIVAMMSGTLDWSMANPIMLVVIAANFLSQLGYPIWGIWLGRMLLRGAISLS